MDSSPKTASLGYTGLVLALALTIAIFGTNALRERGGFSSRIRGQWGNPNPSMFLRVLCGFVLFVLSWMVLRFLFQLGTQVVWRLGQIRERPGLPIAITLLACGTLCVLGGFLLVWPGVTGGPNMSPTMNMPGNRRVRR